MKNKLDKKFFDTHRVPELSAANIFYFSVNAALPDLFQQFDKLAKVKGLTVPDNSEERNVIASLNDPESIVNYMRKLKGIDSRHEMIEKVSQYAEATMPLILKRYLTSALDGYIEIAGRCFIKNDLQYTLDLRAHYYEIRSPYAKAVACLVFGMKGMNDECDFLYEEYEKMHSAYPKESYSDFPLLALHILKNLSNESENVREAIS